MLIVVDTKKIKALRAKILTLLSIEETSDSSLACFRDGNNRAIYTVDKYLTEFYEDLTDGEPIKY